MEAHTPSIKQPTLAESFNRCVPYEKKGSRWTVFTDTVMLDVAKDMVPVYAVEKQEVSSPGEVCFRLDIRQTFTRVQP